MKDREQTKQKLISAVARLLERKGFRSLGVNAIAREAGVDKVLIYRYFGGVSGLLKVFASESDYWPVFSTPPNMTQVANDPAGVGADILLQIARDLRDRPATQEALRWELIERNELTEATHDELREVYGREWITALQKYTDADLPALAAIVGSGLVYLVLRAKTAQRFNGMDLNSEADWQRLEEAARNIISAYIKSVK